MKRASLCLLIIFCATAPAALGAEEISAGLQSRIAVSLAWEHIDYDEKVTAPPPGVASFDLHSDAEVDNAIVGVEGLLLLERIFFAARGVFPLIRGDGDEKWTSFGTRVQTNTLEYGWMRINGVVGVALHPAINPYAGVRWSRVKQTRSDFFSFGLPVPGAVDETIKSWSMVFGVRGEWALHPPLRARYSFEYYHPLDVEVTNTAFPGVEFTDDEGYGWEFRGEIQYAVKERLFVGFHAFGGRMHWDGSEWIGGPAFVKWPENDTNYLGAGVSLNWFF